MSRDFSLTEARPSAATRTLTLAKAIPALIGAALLLPSALWVCLDRSIWPWDPSWYGEVSVDLWATLRTDAGSWPGLMTHAFGAKPPAISWLGQFFIPFGDLIGDDEIAMLLSIVVCQAATIALVYTACRRLRCGNLPSLAAALFVGSAPLFVSMSHEYFAEPVQTLAVAWGLFILASASRWPLALTAAQLPGMIALAMLSKLSSPAYIGLPVFAAIVLALTTRRGRADYAWRNGRVIASAVVSTLLVLGALGWYRVNLQAALDHARLAGADTGLYGVDQGFVKQLPQWAERMRDASVLPHFGLALLVVLAAAVGIAVRRGARPRLDDRLLALASCLATVVLVLGLFASQPNSEIRYLLPLVPCLAIVLGVLLSAARMRAVAVAAVAVLAVEFALVNLQSFGHAGYGGVSYVQLSTPVRGSAFAEELNTIVAQTCTTDSAGKISMIGVEHPWFNHNTIEMLAFERYAESGRKCYYTALGYAENDPNVAWKRVLDFKPPYYIGVDYGNPANPLPRAQSSLISPTDPFNKVNRAVYRRVLKSGLFQIVPESRELGVVVLQAEEDAK